MTARKKTKNLSLDIQLFEDDNHTFTGVFIPADFFFASQEEMQELLKVICHEVNDHILKNAS